MPGLSACRYVDASGRIILQVGVIGRIVVEQRAEHVAEPGHLVGVLPVDHESHAHAQLLSVESRVVIVVDVLAVLFDHRRVERRVGLRDSVVEFQQFSVFVLPEFARVLIPLLGGGVVPPVGAGGGSVRDQEPVDVPGHAFELFVLGDLEHQRRGFRHNLLRALQRHVDLPFHGAGRDDEPVDRVVFVLDGVDQLALYAARGVIRGGVVNGPYLERPVAVCRHSQQGHGYGLLDLFHRFVEQGERKVGREILVQTRIVLVFEIEFVLLRRVVHQPRVGTGGECRDGSGQDGYFENEVFHKSCVIVCNCPLRSAGWASCRSRRRFPRNCLPVSRCPAAIVSC